LKGLIEDLKTSDKNSVMEYARGSLINNLHNASFKMEAKALEERNKQIFDHNEQM